MSFISTHHWSFGGWQATIHTGLIESHGFGNTEQEALGNLQKHFKECQKAITKQCRDIQKELVSKLTSEGARI